MFLILLLFFAINSYATADTETFVRVKNVAVNDVLNIRAYPDWRAPKVGEIIYNARCISRFECIYNSEEKRWCEIDYQGIYGWVYAKYIEAEHNLTVCKKNKIFSYIARIGTQDHYTKENIRIETAASIIWQDRANVHVFNKKDYEDEQDALFDHYQNRRKLAQALENNPLPAYISDEIIFSNPLIKVYFDAEITWVEVEIIE